MGVRFHDGFDKYDSYSDLTNYGGWAVSAAQTGISTTTRTSTGKALLLQDGRAGVTRYSTMTGDTIFTGFSFYTGSASTTFGQIFSVSEDSSTSTAQASLWYDGGDNKLYVRLGKSISTIGSGTVSLLPNTYYWIECKIKIDNTTGIFDVRVNSVLDISVSGDTQGRSSSTTEYISYGDPNGFNAYNSTGCTIDDVYFLDSTGSINNTYLGEVSSVIVKPSGDSSVQFTPTGEASNYLTVDDDIGNPDDDTTYVSSSTIAHKDSYTLEDISSVDTVHAVTVRTRAGKDDTGTRSFKHGITTGANVQSVEYSLSQGYANYIDTFEDQDGAGTAWTVSAVNAAVSTIEVSA